MQALRPPGGPLVLNHSYSAESERLAGSPGG